MRIRPIFMSASMVLALLDGRKTQTRRLVKPQPESVETLSGYFLSGEGNIIRCPYGVNGDLLWVREAWATMGDVCDGVCFANPGKCIYYPATDRHHYNRKRPSIHLRRADSRLTLEIKKIHIERLQEITEIDAIAEGCRPYFDKENPEYFYAPNGSRIETYPLKLPKDDYHRLWESINGAGSWAANPFVWVIEFKPHLVNVDEFISNQALCGEHGRTV